jgi:hypothetical protein
LCIERRAEWRSGRTASLETFVNMLGLNTRESYHTFGIAYTKLPRAQLLDGDSGEVVVKKSTRLVLRMVNWM